MRHYTSYHPQDYLLVANMFVPEVVDEDDEDGKVIAPINTPHLLPQYHQHAYAV